MDFKSIALTNRPSRHDCTFFSACMFEEKLCVQSDIELATFRLGNDTLIN